MDLFDYAIQMEKDGESFYRELAEKSFDRGIETILTRLADAEVGHRKLFEAMKNDTRVELVQDTAISDVKNIFARMKESKDDMHIDPNQKELYRKAQKLESDSEAFYREHAASQSDPNQKAILERLADEEKGHYAVLENLIEFISRPDPGNWLENAEWNNLDEY